MQSSPVGELELEFAVMLITLNVPKNRNKFHVLMEMHYDGLTDSSIKAKISIAIVCGELDVNMIVWR